MTWVSFEHGLYAVCTLISGHLHRNDDDDDDDDDDWPVDEMGRNGAPYFQTNSDVDFWNPWEVHGKSHGEWWKCHA